MDIQKTFLCLALATIAVGGVVAATTSTTTSSGTSNRPTVALSAVLERDLINSGSRIGPATARVQIVEFSDFQCPFCRRLDAMLMSLREKYPNDVAIVFHYFPLERIHQHALVAAVAAECANRLGAFPSMNSALFRAQDSLANVNWTTLAKHAGVVDTMTFQKCVEDPGTVATIRADIARGEMLNVQSTPTVFVSGQRFNGLPREKVLKAAIEGVLRRTDTSTVH